MSTSSANPAKSIKQAAATANGTVSRETLLDYLKTAAKSMRRLELGIGVVIWLITLLLVLVVAVFIDHWLAPLNILARFVVCGLLIAWTVWWLPRRVIPLLFKPIHPEHAARTIEKLYPSMKESLISWLQLSTTDDRTPRGVLAVVARFAARNLNGAESASVLDTGALLKLTSFFAVCLFAFIIYIVAAPKSSVISISRIMMPWASISPASRVVITEVKPGSTKITQGTNLPISIGTRGMYQQDEVYLRYDLSDGQKIGQRIRMKTDVEGLSYSINFGEDMGGIHQPLSYWIEAGDAVAGPFGVKIQTVPIVAVDRLELQYPKYTKLTDRTIRKDGACEVPEGTRIRVFAHANQPMEKSRIEFDPIIERGVLVHTSGLLDLKTQGTEIEGEWTAKLNEEKNNPTLGKYQIKATNSLGEQNDSPVIYNTRVLADLPPVVRLQSELPSMIELPQDKVLEIEIRTNDPDYGLTLVSAIGKSPNTLSQTVPIFEASLFESVEGSVGQKVLKYDFSPTALGLQANTEVEFIAKAVDNRCSPGTDTLEPNVSFSSPIKIKIVKALNQSAGNANKPPKAPDSTKKPDEKNENNPKQSPNKDPKNQGQGQRSSQEKEPSDKPYDPNEPSQNKDQKSKGSSSDEKSSKGENGSDKKNQQGSGSSGTGSSEDSGTGESKEDQAGGTGQNGNQSKSSKKSKGSSSGSGNASSSEPSDTDPSEGNQSDNNQASTGKSSKPSNNQASRDPSNSSSEKTPEQSGGANQEQSKSEGSDGSPGAGESSSAPSKPEHDGERFDAINELREKREKEKQEGPNNNGDKKPSSDASSNTNNSSSSKDDQQSGKSESGKSESGKSESGKSESGKSESGKSESGKSESGKSESGKSESGKSESGKSESGKSESGKSESGKSESGKSESGKSESGKSESGKSESGKSESGKSESGKSESGKSESGKSESGKSESGKSESGKSESGKSESGKSESGKSESGKSESGKSESGKSESGKSESGKSESGKSESGKSESGKSESGKSESGKSESGKSESGKSESGKSESGKSESGKSESGKSESGKSESGKSESGKSESGKSESGKSESGKSESGKSESGKSESGKSESGKSESGKSESGKSESGKSENQPSSSKSGATSAKGQSPQGAKGPSNTSESGQSNQPNAEIKPPETPNSTEYADELTDLALDYLKEQRDQPDPELLRRLDWTKEDMQKFLDRWTQAKEEAKSNPNKKQELEAALRSLGLKSKSQAKKTSDRDDQLKGYLENGSRIRPPESIREKVDKFRRAADKIK